MSHVFKCKMCGGVLEVQPGMTICECQYCGAVQTLPRLDTNRAREASQSRGLWRRPTPTATGRWMKHLLMKNRV